MSVPADGPRTSATSGGGMTVLAANAWRDNAHLIADVARLGYLDGLVVDATYGEGGFWTRWRPEHLVAHDLDPAKGDGVDLRQLPEADASVDAVVLDPPYKLNGRPALGDFDQRYGIHQRTRWQDRVQLYLEGIPEAARVLRVGGYLLLKVQDQVVSGAVRFLTVWLPVHAAAHGLELVDRFDLIRRGRPQPAGRRQVHAHGRPSTLLVFQRLSHTTATPPPAPGGVAPQRDAHSSAPPGAPNHPSPRPNVEARMDDR